MLLVDAVQFRLKQGLISLIKKVCCHLQESSTTNLVAPYEISCEIFIATMAAPLWRLIVRGLNQIIVHIVPQAPFLDQGEI